MRFSIAEVCTRRPAAVASSPPCGTRKAWSRTSAGATPEIIQSPAGSSTSVATTVSPSDGLVKARVGPAATAPAAGPAAANTRAASNAIPNERMAIFTGLIVASWQRGREQCREIDPDRSAQSGQTTVGGPYRDLKAQGGRPRQTARPVVGSSG